MKRETKLGAARAGGGKIEGDTVTAQLIVAERYWWDRYDAVTLVRNVMVENSRREQLSIPSTLPAHPINSIKS